MTTIQFKRGNETTLPTLSSGEPAVTLDTQKVFVGTPGGNVQLAKQSDLDTMVKKVNGVTPDVNGNVVISGSGNSALIYNTVTDLQTAYPSGTTQPAWVVADNAWYYWSSVIVTPDTTAPTVSINVVGGTYTSAQSITLTGSDDSGVNPTIYYTLDGSTPTTSSTVYSSPIAISANTTLKYFAKDGSGNTSSVVTQTYTMNIAVADTTPPTVTASVAGGTYTSSQTVTLTGTDNSGVTPTIYYTLDGSTPTTSSGVYSNPLTISSTTTLKYFAKDASGNASVVQTQVYTINIPDTTPPVVTASPTSGTYTSTQTVTLSATDNSGGATTIYYTVDGSTPTTSSSVYSGAISVSSTETIKYFAKDTAGNSSAVQSATYTINIDTTPPVITASPVTGTYTSAQTVTLSSNETATIYYTTDGTTPTTASTVYTTPISISATTTLQFIGKDTAGNVSTPVVATYTINTTPSGTTIVSDNFNRTDSATTLGGNWVTSVVGTTAVPVWGVKTNQAYFVSSPSGSDFLAYQETSNADNITVSVDMPVILTSGTRLVWRIQDSSNFYVIQPNNATSSALYKRKNNSWVVISSSIATPIPNGATVKVQLIGSTHKVYINGTLAYTFTDTDFQAATKHGMSTTYGDTTGRFDNFSVVTGAV